MAKGWCIPEVSQCWVSVTRKSRAEEGVRKGVKVRGLIDEMKSTFIVLSSVRDHGADYCCDLSIANTTLSWKNSSTFIFIVVAVIVIVVKFVPSYIS